MPELGGTGRPLGGSQADVLPPKPVLERCFKQLRPEPPRHVALFAAAAACRGGGGSSLERCVCTAKTRDFGLPPCLLALDAGVVVAFGGAFVFARAFWPPYLLPCVCVVGEV